MSSNQVPRKGGIWSTEPGEVVVFDGHDWHPRRQMPTGAPFRPEAVCEAWHRLLTSDLEPGAAPPLPVAR